MTVDEKLRAELERARQHERHCRQVLESFLVDADLDDVLDQRRARKLGAELKQGEFDNDCVMGLALGKEIKTDCADNSLDVAVTDTDETRFAAESSPSGS